MYQFELILNDEYEALHYVDRCGSVYSQEYKEEHSSMRNKMLDALNSDKRIWDMSSDKKKIERDMTFGGNVPMKSFFNRNSIDKTMLSERNGSIDREVNKPRKRSRLSVRERYSSPELSRRFSSFKNYKTTRVVEGHLITIRDSFGS
jgi:hypothetical protein